VTSIVMSTVMSSSEGRKTMTPFDRFVTGFVVNAPVQACAVGAVAAVVLRLARASAPGYRHRLAVGALLLTAMVPIATAWLHFAQDGEPSPLASMTSPSPVLAIAPRPATLLVAVYAAVCLWQMLRFGRTAIAASLIRLGATRVDEGPIYDEAQRCFDAWRIAPLRLCTSTHVTVPVLCGVRTPTIILPADFDARDPALLRGIIGHEVAHRARRDIPVAVGLELALMPIAWHPAVALLKRAAAFYRELACDELAIVRLGLSRKDYASGLLQLAERRSPRARFATRIDAHPAGTLERRIAAILCERPAGSSATVSRGVVAAATAAIVVGCWLGTVAIVDPVADTVSGDWRLDTRASQPTDRQPFGTVAMDVRATDAFIHIDQRRTLRDGTFEQLTVRGGTDGRPFDVTMPSGYHVSVRARWHGRRLLLEAAVESRLIEHAEVFRRGPDLVATQVQPDRQAGATYTYVFRRAASGSPR
jgi:beta-lactamase regulating signal transducer with metallopeptidase domain